jgi:Phospholipase_D-nuclease N-terminal
MLVIRSEVEAESAQGAGPVSCRLPAIFLAEGGEMVLADSSYPLLNLFWTMCFFFLWVIWIWILVWVFIDIFRSHDLSGGAKALWFVFVLFIPLIGVLVYLIARGGSMGERTAGGAQR